jgi:flagellar biosynthesis GTPase FlhF
MSPLKTFIIYAHEDVQFRMGLEKFLRHLVRMKKVDLWSDKEIKPGEAWDEVIQKNLQEAELVLMLVSVDFYNSEYIQETEFEQVKERRKRGEVLLVPILVRSCPSYELIKDLQWLPSNATPIGEWLNQDAAYTSVANDIEVLVEDVLRQRIEADKQAMALKQAEAERAAKAEAERAETERKARETAELARKHAEEEKRQKEAQRLEAEKLREAAEQKAASETVRAEDEKQQKIAVRKEKTELEVALNEARAARRRARIRTVIASLAFLIAAGFAWQLSEKQADLEASYERLTIVVGDKGGENAGLETKIRTITNDHESKKKEMAALQDSVVIYAAGLFNLNNRTNDERARELLHSLSLDTCKANVLHRAQEIRQEKR